MNGLNGYEIIRGKDDYPVGDFKIGDLVFDSLTGWGKVYTIKKITGKDGIFGYWIDSDYFGGGRHPWEIVKVRKYGDK